MTDITLPREVVELIENLMHHAYNDGVKQLKYRSSQTVEAEEALRKALAAEQPKPEPVAWRPRLSPNLCFHWSRPWSPGVPSEQTVDYWNQKGAGVEYAYAAPPALAAEPTKQESVESDDDEEFTRQDVTTLLLEVMDWTYAQAHRNRPMTEAEQKVLNDIRTHLAAEPTKQEPVAWQERRFFPKVDEWTHWYDCRPRMADYPREQIEQNGVRYQWRPLYAAPPDAPTGKESLTHPGYVIGNHWFETAYERLCAGEAEDAILEDYEVVREPRLRDLRRDAERYRWGVENARWVRHEHEAYVAIPVAVDADLSCTPMMTAAIDAAMEASTAPASAAADSSTAPEAKP